MRGVFAFKKNINFTKRQMEDLKQIEREKLNFELPQPGGQIVYRKKTWKEIKRDQKNDLFNGGEIVINDNGIHGTPIAVKQIIDTPETFYKLDQLQPVLKQNRQQAREIARAAAKTQRKQKLKKIIKEVNKNDEQFLQAEKASQKQRKKEIKKGKVIKLQRSATPKVPAIK